MFDIIKSKRFLEMPVLPNEGAGWYLDGAVFNDHRDAWAKNSNHVTKIKTPKNLSTSPGVVAALIFERRFSKGSVTIIDNWSSGNINKK
jgi:hypothetical protein